MPAYPVVDTSLLREAARKAKEIDPQIRKELINGLKDDLKPYAQMIAADVPQLGRPGAMRGWNHGGRTRWSPVQASVHVTPGGGKGSVARIEVFGRGEAKAALKIVDLAGTRQNYGYGLQAKLGTQNWYTNVGQGQDMVSRLSDFGLLSAKGKGGRFVWAGFMKYRPMFLDRVVRQLDKYCEKIEAGIS